MYKLFDKGKAPLDITDNRLIWNEIVVEYPYL